MAKTDLEIAGMRHGADCGGRKKIGIEEADLEFYGKYKAKLNVTLNEYKDLPDGKLILVTAINPTKAGEGKSTTTVGLGDGLHRIGKKQ